MDKKNTNIEYFDYNGTRYRSGTRFRMNYTFYHWRIKYDENGNSLGTEWYGETLEVVAHFNYVDKNGDVSITIEEYPNQTTKYGMLTTLKKDEFLESIIEIIPLNYYDEMEYRKRYLKDSQVPELVIGWILYVSIMLILLIFKDRIIGWIFVTAYFFSWRHKKKEEVGTYYDMRS